jgi:hypothetical protein
MQNKNSIFYLLFSIFSPIILFSIFYLLFSFHSTQAATLYAGSAYQLVYQGQTFVVDWFLDTEDQSINAVFLNLNFSTETLEVASADPGQSILNLWVDPPRADNRAGTISLTGGVPAGFNTQNAPIFRTTFRAKKSGNAQIRMDSTSAVLLNDGKGTQAELKFQVLSFIIQPPGFLPVKIVSPTHPDSNKWYRDGRVIIKFEPQPGDEYSCSFSSNVEIFPDDLRDEVLDQIVYENLSDGIYYFKINSRTAPSAKLPAGGPWQEAGIFRVQIDATPPEEFEPLIGADPAVFGGSEFLSFSAVDKTSGMSHYRVRQGILDFWHETKLTNYLLHRPLAGDKIFVQAWDSAGNVRTKEIEFKGYLSMRTFWGLISLAGLILLAFLIKKKFWKTKSQHQQ